MGMLSNVSEQVSLPTTFLNFFASERRRMETEKREKEIEEVDKDNCQKSYILLMISLFEAQISIHQWL